MTLSDFVTALAAPTPVPAGGSAAGVTVSQGAALIAMAMAVTARRTGATAADTALTPGAAGDGGFDIVSALAQVQQHARTALTLATEDGRAFAALLEAQRARRRGDDHADLSAARRETVAVPLQIVRTCTELLRVAVVVAPMLRTSVAPDAWAGAQLIAAGARISLANATLNLRDFHEDDVAAALTTTAHACASDFAAVRRKADAAFASAHGGSAL